MDKNNKQLMPSWENIEWINEEIKDTTINNTCTLLLNLFWLEFTEDDIKDLTQKEKSTINELYQTLNNAESSYKQFKIFSNYLWAIFALYNTISPTQFDENNKYKNFLKDLIKSFIKWYHKNLNTGKNIATSFNTIRFEYNVWQNNSAKNIEIIKSWARIDSYGNTYKLTCFWAGHDGVATKIILETPSLEKEFIKFLQETWWYDTGAESDFLISKWFVKLSPQLQTDERLKNITIPCYLAYTTLSKDQKNKIFDLTGQWIN